ncbi:MAG: hypothetical protein M5U09_04885 [Gammaproteobacteria bacterium]|nr:hypothetical protein [Gammaproteobacteria bacterium]
MPDHLADSELGNPDTVHVCKTLDERPCRRRKKAALLAGLPIPPRDLKVGPRTGRYNTLPRQHRMVRVNAPCEAMRRPLSQSVLLPPRRGRDIIVGS